LEEWHGYSKANSFASPVQHPADSRRLGSRPEEVTHLQVVFSDAEIRLPLRVVGPRAPPDGVDGEDHPLRVDERDVRGQSIENGGLRLGQPASGFLGHLASRDVEFEFVIDPLKFHGLVLQLADEGLAVKLEQFLFIARRGSRAIRRRGRGRLHLAQAGQEVLRFGRLENEGVGAQA
jgi:hypothetical protein